ncbi:MAG: dihydrodipicolinate synthase family protein [Acidobacteriaceae bacterium]|nr:dihydrodipicolinate synthase family protein [Acidobacteriaceae bacterium]
MYEPVLQIAAAAAREFEDATGKRLIKVAGICGNTRPAVAEAEFAREAGYDIALLSLAAMARSSDCELLQHCRTVSEQIPLFGFYLQGAVGGRALSYEFWREFCEIEAAAAIKIAPFNRYQTVDVIRAVADSGRRDIALYTGNDDNIIPDLLTDFHVNGCALHFAGGLLGHWAVWTKRAVELLGAIQECRMKAPDRALDILARSSAVTDANAALFDARNQFRGCIAGLHEILRRQGLLRGRWCLDPAEDLSPGQVEEIDRVCRAYPDLNDDEFVRNNLDRWLN